VYKPHCYVCKTSLTVPSVVRLCEESHTPLQLGHKHQSAAQARHCTYQTLTAKPVANEDKSVSVTELTAAAHSGVPHDAGVMPPSWPSGQALWEITRVMGH
jgi:hypothetical protein